MTPADAALAVRSTSGFARIQRGLLRLTGADRVRFLQGLVTNDVAALTPGAGARATILSVKGRVLSELVVLAEEAALLVLLPAELAAKTQTLLSRYAISDDVEIERVDAELSAFAVVGARAHAVVSAALAGATTPTTPHGHLVIGTARVISVPERGPHGLEVLTPDADALSSALAGAGATAIDDDTLEVLRIEAGEPRYGVDVSEDDFPIEARLDGAISFTKGCYMGQEVIARATARGHLNRKLVGLVAAEGAEVPARGASLAAEARPEAGHVTSAAYSAARGRPIALAYVHRSAWDEGTVLTTEKGERLTVAALPFVV